MTDKIIPFTRPDDKDLEKIAKAMAKDLWTIYSAFLEVGFDKKQAYELTNLFADQ